MSDGLLKILIAPDKHVPQHHEPTIRSFLTFAKDFKPDIYIDLGDFTNFDSLSSYDMRNVNDFVYLEDEIEASNKMLDRFDSTLGSCTKVMLGGNHEERWHRARVHHEYATDHMARSMRKFEDTWATPLHIIKRGWGYFEYGGYYRVGKLVCTHGWYATDGIMDVQRTQKQFPGQNVVCGHNHKHHVSNCLDEKGLPVECESIGTFSRFDLSYLHGRKPTDWVRMFMFVYMRKSGQFTKFSVHVIDGKFMINEKSYG